MNGQFLAEQSPRPYQTLNKVLLSFIGACGVTFAAFAFMQHLISQELEFKQNPITYTPVSLPTLKKDSPVEVRDKLPPPPKPVAKAPPKPTLSAEEPLIGLAGLGSAPTIETGPIQMSTLMTPTDNQATPIVRVEPRYPVTAARDGTQGWVELHFTISETGTVIDARVANAEPKRVFNREALKALKRWKYRPQIINGQPQPQPGQKVVLEFKLNQN
ncbi:MULTISPECIES: energy transducer TonB [unclassified Pseudoalteromonas]|uniref:energy transducer TonB n=1 Tax=unclassified Pseudoalteromonas TaxID=194690 RepID=UPI002096C019|nr:energy transducer TonB [Pseudoalteromonas sp. XMcav2-N]MCO7189723.1 energy transducer TonB [Pseudoalteromonas sp. XMcav2-N]